MPVTQVLVADKSQLKSFKSPLVIQPFVFPPVLGLVLFLTHPLYIPSCIAHVSPPNHVQNLS